MDAPKCRLCGDRHYGICATKSTASRKDAITKGDSQVSGDIPVHPRKTGDDSVSAHGSIVRERRSHEETNLAAGTQAPPVDTRSLPDQPVRPASSSAGTEGDKDRRPFDRRTYARDYMKEWRKRKTEERSTDRAFVEAARSTLDAETFDKILRLAMEKN